jgi:hypothetical protein
MPFFSKKPTPPPILINENEFEGSKTLQQKDNELIRRRELAGDFDNYSEIYDEKGNFRKNLPPIQISSNEYDGGRRKKTTRRRKRSSKKRRGRKSRKH